MLQQLQHIQHADQDLTAEELRYSTFQLVQAFKVLLAAVETPSGLPRNHLVLV